MYKYPFCYGFLAINIFFFLQIQKKSQKIQNAKWKKAEKKFESVAE